VFQHVFLRDRHQSNETDCSLVCRHTLSNHDQWTRRPNIIPHIARSHERNWVETTEYRWIPQIFNNLKLVAPIPKFSQPETADDFRPIYVTQILSRLAEKFIIKRWRRPALNPLSILTTYTMWSVCLPSNRTYNYSAHVLFRPWWNRTLYELRHD